MHTIKLGILAGILAVSPHAEAAKLWPWWPCRQALLADHFVYLPKYVPPAVTELPAPQIDRVTFSHGVTATPTSRNIDQILQFQRQGGMDLSALDLVGMRRSATTIRVTRPDAKDESFARENRSLDFYRKAFFPPKFLNAEALKGRRVFDAGCGSQGMAVKEMRAEGIMAFGGDIYLDASARKSPYLVMLDLMTPPLADAQFDWVLSGFGPLSYLDEVPAPVRQTILKQMFRLTKPGGGILISPYNLEDVQDMVRTLKLNAAVEEIREGGDDGRWVQAVLVRKKKSWFR